MVRICREREEGKMRTNALRTETMNGTGFRLETCGMRKALTGTSRSHSGLLFGIVTVLLVLILLGSCVMTAKGVGYPPEHTDAELILLEREYKAELRVYLEEQGYHNAGINLTHTVDAEGNLSYSLGLHHARFAKLQEASGEKLLEELEQMAEELCLPELQAKFL